MPEVDEPDMPFWTDPSLHRLVTSCPSLAGITKYLPQARGMAIFNEQSTIEELPSSYSGNRYISLFYSLVRILMPRHCVELGVLEGFSLLTIASALRDNGVGKIDGIDLFENYPFRHQNYEIVRRRIEHLGLEEYVNLLRDDALKAHTRYDQVDLLHVDISNNGDTFRSIFQQWASKVKTIMIFEGGSEERDAIRWMIEFQKPSIRQALREIQSSYPD
jgi:hypothetical protein